MHTLVRKVLLISSATLGTLGVLTGTIFLTAASGPRRTPTPRGLVFQVEARQVYHPLDRFEVFGVDSNGPAIAILDRERAPQMPVAGRPSASPLHLDVYRYPSGALLEQHTGAAAFERASELERAGLGRRTFDLDGDGTEDQIVNGPGAIAYGAVQVVSGRDRRELFLDRDPLEYESADRAVALGDLDGDGCAEFALLHPRMDRSRYDFELCDALFGVHSWVSIISGSRIPR